MNAPWQLSALEASRAMAAGRLTSRALTESLLARIRQLDGKLHVWETLDAEGALRAAAAADAAKKRNRTGALHGIPIGLKDIYYTNGLRTSMSSKVFRDFVPQYDAAFVERVKAAGAIVLGKTVTTEFATGDPSPTVNPWDHSHTPGGSSSGSAVGVAVGMMPIASGSQTAGSVVRPAAYNGVVGLKPTYGLVSRYGVFPCSWTLDTLGWMTRTVADAALVLDVVAGYDQRDPASVRAREPKALAAIESMGSGYSPRIGLVAGYFSQKSTLEVNEHVLETVERLKVGGARVEPFELPASFDGIHEAQVAIDYTECSLAHRRTFGAQPDDYAPNIRSRVEVGAVIPASAYVQAQRVRRRFRADMDEALEGFDAIVMPSTPSPAGDTSTTGDPMFQSPWTVAGLPELTLPSGLSRGGLPIGIQFVGRGFEDTAVLRVAAWAEAVLGAGPGWPGEDAA